MVLGNMKLETIVGEISERTVIRTQPYKILIVF